MENNEEMVEDKQFSGKMFYDFLNHKSLVDVTLSAGGQSMKAHKLILACSSSWFQVGLLVFKRNRFLAFNF